MHIIFFWIAAALIFLIIEMMTATFYGLSLAMAAGIVATWVFFAAESGFTIAQGVVFVIASIVFAFWLPKLLVSKQEDKPQGADIYIGEKRSVKKQAGSLKISLDGVDYNIESDDDVTAGDKVEVVGHKGTAMKVKKV